MDKHRKEVEKILNSVPDGLLSPTYVRHCAHTRALAYALISAAEIIAKGLKESKSNIPDLAEPFYIRKV